MTFDSQSFEKSMRRLKKKMKKLKKSVQKSKWIFLPSCSNGFCAYLLKFVCFGGVDFDGSDFDGTDFDGSRQDVPSTEIESQP